MGGDASSSSPGASVDESPTAAGQEAATAQRPPTFELFSVGQVTAAAFFGSPIAGGILMAMNMRRLGRSRDARNRLLVGIGLTVLLGAFATFVPGHAGNFIPVVGVLAIRAMAQGDKAIFDAHLASGGKKAGVGQVVLVAAASFVTVLLVIFLALMPSLHLGPFAEPSVDFGHGQEITYVEGATAADAKKLGEFLKEDGVFDDTSGKEARLSRRGAAYVVGLEVKDGTWDDPHSVHVFDRMGGRIALSAFPGSEVTLEMLNDGVVKKALESPALFRREFGPGQRLTFDAGVGEATAKKVGDYLVESTFFGPNESPKDVEVRKEGTLIVVSFLFADGRWDEPALVKEFEKVRGHIAEALPDKKVRVDLCNLGVERQRSIGP